MIDHDALRSLAALYALGTASAAERKDFEAHLTTCAECRAELAELRRVLDALALSAPAAAPAPHLRDRILAAAGNDRGGPRQAERRSSLPWWLSAAASLIAVIALAQWWSTANRLEQLSVELATAREQLASAERLRASAERTAADSASRLAILAAPDAVPIPLAGQAVSPNAAGRVVFSPSRGVIFTATNLPPLPAGRVYQLWAVTAPAPVGIALVRPGDGGQADTITTLPAGVAPAAFALTIEPEGGSPGPTGAMYLVGSR